jgi:hypothetical protein
VDNVHTSDEERGQLKNQMLLTQNAFAGKVLEYEGKLMEMQASIITAEAQGHSWLQRTWRPITMLTFLVLIILDSFGLLAFRLSAEAWTLLKIGLGGYVVGRSAEKVIPSLAQALKKN